MRKEQVWSISTERAERFFRAQPDVLPDGDGFRFRDCRITLTTLPPKGAGMWNAPQTKLTIDGSDADVSAIYYRFFLHFLSAGG